MLTKKLKEYAQSGVYPMHMPGHKRHRVGCLPLKMDVTEIHGFDNLHHPTGCIREIEQHAARLWQAERAFMLVNGATGGILAAIRAMTRPDDTVVIARNCHRSVYNAVELCGLKPVYYMPDLIDGTDIYGSVYPEMLDMLLQNTANVRLVVITSPTYEGVCSDIDVIAAICHAHGARLLVDEAHGAHFPFHARFPQPAVSCGADAAVTSLHKTLPSPTQTALLLTNDRGLEGELQRQLAVFETSSPSYLLMSGVEDCLTYLEDHSFKEYIDRLDTFYTNAKQLQKLRLLFDPGDDNRCNIDAYDCGKLVVTAYGTELSGGELARRLREEHQIETEMSSAHYVIAMTSVCDTDEGFDRLLHALLQIDKTIGYSANASTSAVLAQLPQKAFEPFDSRRRRAVTVPFADAAGKTAMETIYAYPPGIPYIVPGEVISQSILEQLAQLLSNGVEVTSATKQLPQSILVADW